MGVPGEQHAVGLYFGPEGGLYGFWHFEEVRRLAAPECLTHNEDRGIVKELGLGFRSRNKPVSSLMHRFGWQIRIHGSESIPRY